jgi:hypothetical protein
MSDNNNNTDNKDTGGINDARRKYACLKLNHVDDVKEIIRVVNQEIFDEDSVVENAGRITNLLQVFLRATDSAKLEEIDSRLKALEDGKQ